MFTLSKFFNKQPKINILELELNNGEKLPIYLRKSLKAKSIRIRIINNLQKIELIIPNRISMIAAQDFLNKHKDWVSHHYNIDKQIILEDGAIISIFGNNMQIQYIENKRGITHFENDKIFVYGLKEYLPQKLKKFLLNHLKEEIIQYATIVCQELGLKYQNITVKEVSTRWGSCSSAGNLSFCWRLIFAPRSVLDYVIIHEICHLQEMNHSNRFWLLVALIMPDYKNQRKWLKENGHTLSVKD